MVRVVADSVALFGAGVASFLAPCVVPLVPAYLGLIVGESADAGDPARAVPATVVFIVGFATVFAGLGVAAGLVGSALDDVQDGIQRVGGVLVALMGLSLLRADTSLFNREWRAIRRLPSGGGPARPFVVGVAFGAAWTPCVGPLLGAALVVAANSASAVEGGVLLISYALGIGVPFLLVALAAASSPGLARRLASVANRVERIAGVALIALGIALTMGWYDRLAGYLARFTPSIAGL